MSAILQLGKFGPVASGFMHFFPRWELLFREAMHAILLLRTAAVKDKMTALLYLSFSECQLSVLGLAILLGSFPVV